MEVVGYGNGRVVKLNQYWVKIYNKSLQCALPRNILRIEKRVKRMEHIRKQPIYLATLTDPSLAIDCLKNLVETFEFLIVTEEIDNQFITSAQQKLIDKGNNPRMWKPMSRNQRCTNKKKYNSLIEKYGTQKLKPEVYNLLRQKAEKLINI